MRKSIPFVLILLCVMAFAVSYASAEKGPAAAPELTKEATAPEVKLPAFLSVIGDEAFEGTALVKVDLPQTVTEIGERAFAEISTLREVRIPAATSYIASTAFEGSNRTTITAPVNSYARKWAKNHGLPFSPVVMLCASSQGSSISVLSVNLKTEDAETGSQSAYKPETCWRKIAEADITQREALIANHVQGRSPPMA